MARTEAEKYTLRHRQDERGQWYTYKEINHDPAFCDICDSEDVEQPAELVTGNGWYGGVKILWYAPHGVHGAQVVAVLCRRHMAEHYEAAQSAPRKQVMVDDAPETVYYCPAHDREEIDYAGAQNY